MLPTSGTARFFSPLSVDAFVKKSSFIYYTEDALREASEDIVRFANREGLTAHANSILVRKRTGGIKMSYLLCEKIRNLKPYDPIEGEYKIRLDANESYFVPDEALRQEMAKRLRHSF